MMELKVKLRSRVSVEGISGRGMSEEVSALSSAGTSSNDARSCSAWAGCEGLDACMMGISRVVAREEA